MVWCCALLPAHHPASGPNTAHGPVGCARPSGPSPWPAPCVTLLAVTGITNNSLRALMTGLLGQPYGTNRASYDLTRLRRNGLIVRVDGRHLYRLTDDGLAFAIFYSKVHNRVLRPLLATPAPPTPPPLRTIDQHLDARIADARLPSAAA